MPRNGSSSNPSGASAGNPKTAAIQAQIDDTVGIMRENITKVAERGERLDSLQDKTGVFSPYHSLPLWPAPRSYGRKLAFGPISTQSDRSFSLLRQPCRFCTGFPSGGKSCPEGVLGHLLSLRWVLISDARPPHFHRICGKHKHHRSYIPAKADQCLPTNF